MKVVSHEDICSTFKGKKTTNSPLLLSNLSFLWGEGSEVPVRSPTSLCLVNGQAMTFRIFSL